VGASYFLSRLPGALGIYLALTGVQIRGADALYSQLADVYLPPAAIASLGGDLAGFPNGRRPYDDVVDITLRAAEGALCGAIGNCGAQTTDPNNGLPYTDGARAAGADAASEHVTGEIKAADTYLAVFPYLNTPLPGSPNGLNGVAK